MLKLRLKAVKKFLNVFDLFDHHQSDANFHCFVCFDTKIEGNNLRGVLWVAF